MRKFVLLTACATFVAAAAGTDNRCRLGNDDIIRLVKAGFSETVLLNSVQTCDGSYDASAESVATLRKASVAESVIAAMQKSRKSPANHLKLLEPGVYFRRSDDYGLVTPEAVAWHASTSPSGADSGLAKVSLNGRIDGRISRVPVAQKVELLIVSEPGHSWSEYQLVRADVREDYREFRVEAALKDGAVVGMGCADKNLPAPTVDDSFDLGTRIKLDGFRKGEYGIIPPHVIAGGRVVPTGQIYTFTIE